MSLTASEILLSGRALNDSYAGEYGTCGGKGFLGPTQCSNDWICAYINIWVSTCISPAKPQYQKTCTTAGFANSDIAGLGVLIAIGLQTLIAIFLTFLCWWKGESGKKKLLTKLLLVTLDTQLISGIALLVSALAVAGSIDLYHLHIAWDVISVSAASMWPAFYQASVETQARDIDTPPRFVHRLITALLFCILYIVLTALFGKRLKGWDKNKPGQCFEGNVFLRPTPEDSAQQIELILCLFASMILIPILITIWLSRSWRSRGATSHSRSSWFFVLLGFAVLQIVFHVSFFGILRNKPGQYFLSPESENQMGFGQISIIIFSLLPVLFELVG